MKYINGYNVMKKYKVLSEKETGLGGKWYLVDCGDNNFAYGTLAEIQRLFFVPVDQFGTREEIIKHCERIIKIKKKNINKYEREMIKDKKNPNAYNMLIEFEKKEWEMLADFSEKLR